ncbi:MAG TPA: gliding motility-associated C-terminal domain-containing protein, partial [Bacteroidetes bacterium]|nr:gliding motility-associated C-terminal domain-containing protein [Bacteroidota bacterium]
MVKQAQNIAGKNTLLQYTLQVLLSGLLSILSLNVSAQFVDENTPKDTLFTGVGQNGHDYIAQSFKANITSIEKIGVWLQQESPAGEVNLLLLGDNGANRPDFNQVYHSSNLLMAPTTGTWFYETGFSSSVRPGQQYWIVVDGHNNLQTSGQSSVGISNTFTDTNEPLYYSSNGGNSWTALPGQPMAINVAGDSCIIPLSITPAQPVICPGQTLELSVPGGFLSYSWSNGITSANAVINQAAIYTVSVVDHNLCLGVDTADVVIGTVPIVLLDSQYTICRGDSITLSVIPFYDSYLWSTGAATNTIIVKHEGEYSVEVESTAGCITRDTTQIYVQELPTVELGEDTMICLGEFVFLDAGDGFMSYNWSNGQGGRSVFVVSTDTISVQVQDSTGCWGSSDTVIVTANPNPISPVITPQFENLMSTFAIAYQWYSNNGALAGETGQNLSNPAPGDYYVVIFNAFGCKSASDTITVTSEVIGNFISEGFSPNGDGLNEVFFVEGIGQYMDNTLVVFNRYGDEVYRKSGYQNGWDGKGKGGRPLADGNYFYVL